MEVQTAGVEISVQLDSFINILECFCHFTVSKVCNK